MAPLIPDLQIITVGRWQQVFVLQLPDHNAGSYTDLFRKTLNRRFAERRLSGKGIEGLSGQQRLFGKNVSLGLLLTIHAVCAFDEEFLLAM